MKARAFLRQIQWFALAATTLVLGAWLLGGQALAGRPTVASAPSGEASKTTLNDAYLEFVPGAPGNCPPPSNGGTTTVGCRFTLDLMLDAGTKFATSQHSYLTFTYSLIQNARVQDVGSSCVLTSTVSPDLSTFDALLQNEVCNGPNPCNFRGIVNDPGWFSYASGALNNCFEGCGGRFRVARMGVCAIAPGQAVLHWQFSPPAPPTRDTQIGPGIENPALFEDYVFNIIIPSTGTPTVTSTSTPLVTPVFCPPGFQDVPPGHPDYAYIHCATCQTSMEAYACGSPQEPCVPPNNYPYFRPDNNYIGTIADVCRLIVSAARWPIDTTGGPHFPDVPTCHPYYIYIETAFNRGLVLGTPGEPFNPDRVNIARHRFAHYLHRALTELVPETPTPTATPCAISFSDVFVTDYFYVPVMYLACRDVIRGYPDSTFRPYNNIRGMTRAEMAGVIARAYPNCYTAPTPVISPTCTVSPSLTNTPTPCTPNYTYATATAAIVPGVTDTGNHCDDCTTAINLPFPFTLYESSYSTAIINSNGRLSITAASDPWPVACMPRSWLGPVIFAFDDDLRTDLTATCNPSPCGVYTSVTGSAPNRLFNIEWRAAYFAGTGSVNFEISLYEGLPSRFDVVIGRRDGPGDTALIGVQDGANRFTEFGCNTPVPNNLRVAFTLGSCGTSTPTPIPTRTIRGHVTWDGRQPQPDPSQMLPISLTMRPKNGGPYIDYPLQNTDENGYFAVDVTNLQTGEYYWRVKGPKYLANSGVLTLTGGPVTTVEMGLMLAGDSDGNNAVNISDFNIMKSAFGWSCAEGGYDERAEFTGDCRVSITDFLRLKVNFGATGAPQIRPFGP